MKKRVGLGVVVLIVAWVIGVGLLAASAYSAARKGQNTLTAVSHGDITSLRNGSQDAALKTGAAQLKKAHDRLANPLLWPVRPLPFVGRQLQSSIALTNAGSKTSTIALNALVQARPLVDNAKTDRAGSLAKIAVVLKNSDTQLRTVTLGPKQHLFGPVKTARAKAVTQLNTIDHALVQGGAASDGLGRLLSTSGSYLLVAANNGEMRNGSGMFLQVGNLTTGNGKLSVTNMQSVGALNAKDGLISWPRDLATNWGWLGHQGAYQNDALSPRYDISAPIAEEIWQDAGKPKVDGVVTMDVDMLKALIATTGPVSAGGKTLTADNVEQELLLTQYAGVTNTATNNNRRDALSDVAAAAFTQFNGGNWDIATAAKQMGKAAEGRHILVYSNDADLNTDWVTAGVGGVVAPTDTMVSLANLSTNKLDQFIKMDNTMSVAKANGLVNTTISITVTNTAPATGSSYVLGPTENSELKVGDYAGMLTATIPNGATLARFTTQAGVGLPLSVNGQDGNSFQIGTAVDVPRGNVQTFVLHYSQPDTSPGTYILPSARIPAVTWHYGSEAWLDDHTHQIVY